MRDDHKRAFHVLNGFEIKKLADYAEKVQWEAGLRVRGNLDKSGKGEEMSKQVRINELLDYIRAGRIMDAMHEFYAEDVVMDEPAYGKTVGLEANLKREEKFLEGVAEFKKFEAIPAVGENFSSYENVMAWTSTEGEEIQIEQVAVQHWKDGKIIYERFYYNMG